MRGQGLSTASSQVRVGVRPCAPATWAQIGHGPIHRRRKLGIRLTHREAMFTGGSSPRAVSSATASAWSRAATTLGASQSATNLLEPAGSNAELSVGSTSLLATFPKSRFELLRRHHSAATALSAAVSWYGVLSQRSSTIHFTMRRIGSIAS